MMAVCDLWRKKKQEVSSDNVGPARVTDHKLFYALPLATQQYIMGIKGAAFPDSRLPGPNNINNTYSNLE